MSFKQNDTNDNSMIHLGNYEEYFILYMDNELSDEQMKMVDEFLVQHPDLQGEFELLMSTRLPMEELNIDKNEFMSDRMRLSTVDEELLLYVDNELPAEEKKVVELELKNNKDYQLQHQLLMRSKLDASDKVIHPNKKELYRNEERKVVAFRPWMRIAAAVVVIAVSGVLYFNNSSTGSSTSTGKTNLAVEQGHKDTKSITPGHKEQNTQKPENTLASSKDQQKQPKINNKKSDAPTFVDDPQLQKDVINRIAQMKKQNEEVIQDTEDPGVLKDKTPIIENRSFGDVAIAEIKTPSGIINKNPVTSALANRKTDVVAATEKDVASNKGSVKGFLRKTTRLIEKKTGIDPTNDGQLLIGAVAINLN